MAKVQTFNSMFVSTLLIFSILAVISLLILTNLKKEKYYESIPYSATCNPSSSNIMTGLNIPSSRYTSYFQDGWVQKLKDTECTLTNVLIYPGTKRTFINGSNTYIADCGELGLSNVSLLTADKNVKMFNSDRRIESPNFNDVTKDDCYIIPTSSSGMQTVINQITEVDKRTQQATLVFLQDRNNKLNNVLATTTSQLNAANQSLTSSSNLLQSTQNALTTSKSGMDVSEANMNRVYTAAKSAIAEYSKKVPMLVDTYNFAGLRTVQDTSLSTMYIQKRCSLSNRAEPLYFSLMYKYGADDQTIRDSSDAWFNRQDINLSMSSSIGTNGLQDLINPSISYRNNTLINEIFGDQKPPAYVLVEIYNVSNNNIDRLGYMIFDTSAKSSDKDPTDYLGKWFSPFHYVEGDVSGVHKRISSLPPETGGNFRFFGIRGDEWYRRRWFIQLSYDGCGNDKGVMCISQYIPYNGRIYVDPCIYAPGKILLSPNGKDFSGWNNYSRGNILMVWGANISNDPRQKIILDATSGRLNSSVTIPK